MTQDVSNGGASEQTHSHVDLGRCSCRISRKSRHWTQNTNTYISFKTHQHKNSKNQHFTAKEIWADPRGKKNQNLQLSNLIYEHQSSNKVSTFKAIAKFLSLVILPDGDDDQSCADKHHWQIRFCIKVSTFKATHGRCYRYDESDRKARPMDHRFSLEVTFFFGVRGLEGIRLGMALWIHHRERDREVGMIERKKLKQPWKRGEKGSIKATRVA